jgi:hypothetical protein
MSEIKPVDGNTIARAFLLYFFAIVAAGVAFSMVRDIESLRSWRLFVFPLFGPALSLFTHMAYLFPFHTLLLIPWVWLWLAVPRARLVAVAFFLATWIGVGWYMHEVF